MTKGGNSGTGTKASGAAMGATNMPATMPPTSMGNPQMNNANVMQGPMSGPGSQQSRMNGTGTTGTPTAPSAN